MKKLEKLALALLIIAGINWALWGFWDINIVSAIFGREWIDRLVYFLFGISGIYVAYRWKRKLLG